MGKISASSLVKFGDDEDDSSGGRNVFNRLGYAKVTGFHLHYAVEYALKQHTADGLLPLNTFLGHVAEYLSSPVKSGRRKGMLKSFSTGREDEQRKEIMELATGIYHDYIAPYGKNFPKPLYVERNLQHQVNKWLTITAKPDAVYRLGNVVQIVDYKSHSNRKKLSRSKFLREMCKYHLQNTGTAIAVKLQMEEDELPTCELVFESQIWIVRTGQLLRQKITNNKMKKLVDALTKQERGY